MTRSCEAANASATMTIESHTGSRDRVRAAAPPAPLSSTSGGRTGTCIPG
jgi:hypothetical protein